VERKATKLLLITIAYLLLVFYSMAEESLDLVAMKTISQSKMGEEAIRTNKIT